MTANEYYDDLLMPALPHFMLLMRSLLCYHLAAAFAAAILITLPSCPITLHYRVSDLILPIEDHPDNNRADA